MPQKNVLYRNCVVSKYEFKLIVSDDECGVVCNIKVAAPHVTQRLRLYTIIQYICCILKMRS